MDRVRARARVTCTYTYTIALLACHLHATPTPPKLPAAGISIALYDTYALVDDRRYVDVTSGTLALEHIDPGAALASLVIESPGLKIGECTRDALPELQPNTAQLEEVREAEEERVRRRLLRRRLRRPLGEPPPEDPMLQPASEVTKFAPVVRCAVTGAPGRYLVRIEYVTAALKYRALHEVDLTTADRATVASRFAIDTPAWHERAEVVVFDGVPGGARTPREIVRGDAELDGSTAVLATPSRIIPVTLRRIFDGALASQEPKDDPDLPANDPLWGRESVQDVWLWLELPELHLAPGAVRVHVALADEPIRDVDVTPAHRIDTPTELRLPLWIDPQLHGMRQRFPYYSDGASLAERFLITVSNLGSEPREVWIEEHLRPSRHRKLEHVFPGTAQTAGDVVRAKVLVRPGKLERVGFIVAYRDE